MEPSQSVLVTVGVIYAMCNIRAGGETLLVDVAFNPESQAMSVARTLELGVECISAFPSAEQAEDLRRVGTGLLVLFSSLGPNSTIPREATSARLRACGYSVTRDGELTIWLRVTTLPPSEIAAAAQGVDLVSGAVTASSPSPCSVSSLTTSEIPKGRDTTLLNAAAPIILQIWPRGSNGVLLLVRKRSQLRGDEIAIAATDSFPPQAKELVLKHIGSHLRAAKILPLGVVLPGIVRWVGRQRSAHERILLSQKNGESLCDSDNEHLKMEAKNQEAWKASLYGQLWSNNSRGEPLEILPLLRQVQAQHTSRHIPCIPCFTLHNICLLCLKLQ